MNKRMINPAFLVLTSLLLALVSSTATAQVSCGDYAFSDITLRADLRCSGSGFALNPVGSDITIDLNGYTIEGPDNMRGISLVGAERVKIIGPGVIRGFWAGISALDSDDLEVRDLIFFEVGSGILLQQASRALIENNQFIYTRAEAVHLRGLASWARSTKGNRVVNNEFYKSRIGVAICGKNAVVNRIENNLIWQSEDWGVRLTNTDFNSIEGNEIIEAQSSAVLVENASKNTVISNTLEKSRIGLSIGTTDSSICGAPETVSEKNTVQYNYASYSTVGMFLGGGPGVVRENLLSNNKIYDDDIGLFFDDNALDNDAEGNGYQGTIEKIVDYGSGNAY